MIGSSQPKVLVEFYEKILGKPTMQEDDWAGWQVGSAFINVSGHSGVKGKASNPERMILNFETKDIKEEYERIKGQGATVIKELYEMDGMKGMWIATFADPDGNYFQLMTPWEGNK